MSQKVNKYALTESIVGVVQWVGGERAYKFLTKWTDFRVRMSGTDLVLQSPDQDEKVELGEYIVKVGPTSFYKYTFDELKDIYTKIG